MGEMRDEFVENTLKSVEYKLDDFDSEVEMLEKINEQQATIEDLQKTNQEVLEKYLMLRLKIGELLD